MKELRHIPVQKGKTYDISIVRLGSSGEGVGRYEGFTVFVPFALPGETVRARITLVKKTYATASLVEVLKPSPDRIQPQCPVYDRCGGCQLQHLSYEGELKEKRQQVRDALERIGHLQGLDVLPTLGAHTPWHYRNKMQFPVAAAGKGKVAIGCFAAATHEVIDVTDCAIQKEGNNAIVAVVRQWMKDFKIPAYDEDARTGIVRHIMGRVGVHTGEIMVCLVTACDMVPHMKDLVQRLRRDIPGLTSVVQNVNKRHTNVILGPKTKTVYGKGTIHDSIGPLTFHISAQSFFQVNSEQAQRLYETALDFADLKGGETVADVYCGTGTITLFLAQKAKFVRGVEIVPAAIENAKENAKLNGLENTEFFVGKAEEVLPREYKKNGVYADVIVVDPPRKGCDSVCLDTIVKMAPEKVVYVSCDSATLARDVKYLGERGYEVKRVKTVDMFPWSGHVETVVLMSRK
mgnify:CR=1 FL=1